MDRTGHICIGLGAGIARLFTENGYLAALDEVLYVTGIGNRATGGMTSNLTDRERYISEMLQDWYKS